MHAIHLHLRTPAFTIALLAALAIALAGCGGGGGGGGGGSGAAVTMTPSFPSFQGTATLSGTVSFPSSVGAGRAIQIAITETGGFATEFATGSIKTTGLSATFAVNHLAAGTYKIRIRVDRNGNGLLSDDEDLDGYYDGTTGSPIYTSGSATGVPVTAGASVSGITFGVGPLAAAPKPAANG